MTKEQDPAFFGEGAQSIAQRLDRDMSRLLEKCDLAPRVKLAVACRKLADEGHARTLAGQITLRADPRDTFWTTHFGAGFAETTASNVVRMDGEMRTVEGQGMANPAVRFHPGGCGAVAEKWGESGRMRSAPHRQAPCAPNETRFAAPERIALGSIAVDSSPRQSTLKV